MFTGLIKEVAKVISYKDNFLTIESSHNPNIGDSISINGACLTVVKKYNKNFVVELSKESRSCFAVENLKDFVHIEPAMLLSDRIDGHLVQGHIDVIGEILNIKKNENGTDFFIKIPQEFIKFIVPKGSVSIDGVSLTINDVYQDSFKLTIIPHTMEQTLFYTYKQNRRVNIETDMIARYLHHIVNIKENKLNWNDVDRIMALF